MVRHNEHDPARQMSRVVCESESDPASRLILSVAYDLCPAIVVQLFE